MGILTIGFVGGLGMGGAMPVIAAWRMLPGAPRQR